MDTLKWIQGKDVFNKKTLKVKSSKKTLKVEESSTKIDTDLLTRARSKIIELSAVTKDRMAWRVFSRLDLKNGLGVDKEICALLTTQLVEEGFITVIPSETFVSIYKWSGQDVPEALEPAVSSSKEISCLSQQQSQEQNVQPITSISGSIPAAMGKQGPSRSFTSRASTDKWQLLLLVTPRAHCGRTESRRCPHGHQQRALLHATLYPYDATRDP